MGKLLYKNLPILKHKLINKCMGSTCIQYNYGSHKMEFKFVHLETFWALKSSVFSCIKVLQGKYDTLHVTKSVL